MSIFIQLNLRNLLYVIVFCGRSEGILHDQCDRVAECHAAQAEPSEVRISKRSGTSEGAVPGHVRSHQKMDDADPELWSDPGRTGDHVPGQDPRIEKIS